MLEFFFQLVEVVFDLGKLLQNVFESVGGIVVGSFMGACRGLGGSPEPPYDAVYFAAQGGRGHILILGPERISIEGLIESGQALFGVPDLIQPILLEDISAADVRRRVVLWLKAGDIDAVPIALDFFHKNINAVVVIRRYSRPIGDEE